MRAFVDTFVCVHKEESWTHRIKHCKSEWRERRGVEQLKSGGRSWKRRSCREPRYRELHDVNANQVFYWRKLYREGQLGRKTDTQLVPVKVANDRTVEAVKEDDFLPRSGTLEIKLSKGTLRIFGTVDVMTLRVAIECLIG